MPESSAAELHVRLPQPLAEEVERMRERDPEALARIIAYGVTRRVIFDYLVARDDRLEAAEALRY
jgi:hypothetical protein